MAKVHTNIKNLKKICFIGQMKYKHHRDKFAGVMRYANTHHGLALQQFDYTQIPQKLSCALLKNMDLDGLIFGDSAALLTFAEYLHYTTKPVIVLDSLTLNFPGVNEPDVTIELDNKLISKRIAQFFLKRGYQNFAYIGYNEDRWIPLDRIHLRSHVRELAFVETITSAGFTCQIKNVSGRFDEKEKREILEWLRALPKPCAIMAFWDNLARDVVDVGVHGKIRVPEQIAIIGTDNDTLLCESGTPTLTTIPLAFEDAGFRAAKELQRLMDNPHERTHKHLTYGPLDIIERGSTRDFKGAGRIVTAACDYITKHIHEPIRATDIARKLNVSLRTLQLRFAEVLNRTLASEISRQKIEAAISMAQSTTLTSPEIAHELGYEPHHFINLLKKKTGQSIRSIRRTSMEGSAQGR